MLPLIKGQHFFSSSMLFQHVGWWSPTIIRGENREAIHIPNHKFTVNVVRNLSQKTHWRIKTHLAISHMDASKINVRNYQGKNVFVDNSTLFFVPLIIIIWYHFLVQNIVADMRKVLAKNPQVEQQKLHRRVFLDNIDPENQALLVSSFVEFMFVCQLIQLGIILDLKIYIVSLVLFIRNEYCYRVTVDLMCLA